MTITGTVVWVDISGGFWGIVADEGSEYFPVNMPEELKKDKLKVQVIVHKVPASMSVFMWGEAVRVKRHTLL